METIQYQAIDQVYPLWCMYVMDEHAAIEIDTEEDSKRTWS